jgi:hypothetical protein
MERGAGGGYGFVLAMEHLFERFLEVTLGRALRDWLPQLELKTQDSRPFAYPVDGGRKYFTRPDDVIYSGDEPIVVVDAKYKRLASKGELALRKPRNADVYQILAAMTAHGCRRGVLIFPKVSASADLGDDQLRWWRVPTFGEEVQVAAIAIDLMELRSRSDIRRLDRRLADLVCEVGDLEPIGVDVIA